MNKKILISVIIAVVVMAALLLILNSFYKPAARSTQSSKLQVAASFYPLYYFAQQIAGDKANIINITPSGAEPHDYEPTAQDIAHIDNSRLLVLEGPGLESWGDNITKNLDPKNTLVVTAGEGLTTQQVMEDGKQVLDPHVWQSPVLAKQMVDKIAAGFAQIDPANKDYYQSSANALKMKLDVLDQEYRQGLGNCQQKNIITSHAAFGYLATTYGLQQVPIAGLSPDAEPSPQQLADIVKFAKANKVTYIFFESLVSPKLSDTIATEVGAKTLVLNPIEGLTNEELAQGKNYITEMEHNLTNLKIALECK